MRYEKGDISDGLLIQGIIRQIKKKKKRRQTLKMEGCRTGGQA